MRQTAENLVDGSIGPWLNQIFVPLLSIVDDPKAGEDLRELDRSSVPLGLLARPRQEPANGANPLYVLCRSEAMAR